MRRSIALYLFSVYSYSLNAVLLLSNLLPPPFRVFLLRGLFARMGRHPFIDYGTYFRYPRKITLGHEVSINRGCEFYASQRAKAGTITIGNNVVFGPYVRIFAAGHDYGRLDLPDIAAPVVINDHVWVGGNATILPGVVIGEGCVIGAGSVVTKDLPPYSIAVGNPAKVIKSRVVTG